MPGQPNIRDSAPAERRVSGVRRATSRDYQAQSHHARSSVAGRRTPAGARRGRLRGRDGRAGEIVSRRRAASAVTASGREGCLASPIQGTRLAPSGGIGSAGRPRGTTRRSPTHFAHFALIRPWRRRDRGSPSANRRQREEDRRARRPRSAGLDSAVPAFWSRAASVRIVERREGCSASPTAPSGGISSAGPPPRDYQEPSRFARADSSVTKARSRLRHTEPAPRWRPERPEADGVSDGGHSGGLDPAVLACPSRAASVCIAKRREGCLASPTLRDSASRRAAGWTPPGGPAGLPGAVPPRSFPCAGSELRNTRWPSLPLRAYSMTTRTRGHPSSIS